MHATISFSILAQRIFAAALFLLGLTASIYGWNYGIGQLNDIGPGAFPLGLGLLIMVLSGIILASIGKDTPSGQTGWKPLVFIPAGIAIWALLIEAGGLLIANTALISMMYFSEDGLKIFGAILLAICLTVGGYIVLVLGFSLPFHIIGEWP